MIVFLGLKLFHEALRFPFGPALSVEPGADRIDTTGYIVKQVFFAVLRWIDYLDRSSLDF